jgi:glycosyltransferase involved in cell wall biosynthesis
LKKEYIAIIAKGSGISLSFEAVNTKSYFIAKILKKYGINVTILSGLFYQKEAFDKFTGRYEGIKYYMPSVFKKPNSKWRHYYYKLMYIWQVIYFLFKMKKKWKKVYFIFDDNSTPLPILLLLQIFGIIELIFNIEEWPLSHNISFIQKIISHIFIILSFKFCRKSICISSFLIKKATFYNKNIETFKLPALAKFNNYCNEKLIESNNQNQSTKFLFCGNVGYSEVIWVIINSYENIIELMPNSNVELILILHGDVVNLHKISKYINKTKSSIKLLSRLTEPELMEELARASVLMAPLRRNIQDEARFPQKIAEYTAISKPIITTNIGDIGSYFSSNDSAIFIEDLSIKEITQKMCFAIENKQILKLIGENGNLIGRRHFDYQKYIYSLGKFITS